MVDGQSGRGFGANLVSSAEHAATSISASAAPVIRRPTSMPNQGVIALSKMATPSAAKERSAGALGHGTEAESVDPVLGISFALGLGVLAFYVWVIVDVIRKPDWLWQRARMSGSFWKGMFTLGWLVGIGFPMTVVHLVYVRPKLMRAQRSRERGEPWSASGRVTDPLV